MSTVDLYEGRPDRECGEHRTTGGRAWCLHCSEWCSPDAPCARCELSTLRAEVERLPTELRNPGNDLLDVMTERSPLIIKRTAIEVVREGRFSYVVVERMDSGLDRTWEPPHWFRRRAERQARRLANPNWYEPQTVLRIEVSA